MKLLRRIATVLLVSLISVGGYAQKNFAKEADAKFANEQYFSAIDAYKKAETKAKPAEKARINFQLGECIECWLTRLKLKHSTEERLN